MNRTFPARISRGVAQLAGGKSLRRPFMGIGLLGLLATTALVTYSAVTTDRFAADLAITRWLQQVQVNDTAVQILSYVLFEGLVVVLAASAILWLWFKGHRVDAFVVVLAMAPNGFVFLLRDFYGRPRPSDELVHVLGSPVGMSFPSGHAVVILFFVGFLLYILTRYRQSKRLVYTAVALWLLYIPFAGLLVVYHGRHWSSDVFGGFLYSGLFFILYIKLFHIARAWESRHPELLGRISLRRTGQAILRRLKIA